jgi:hypothetical protein
VALLCQRLVLREVFEFRFLQSDPNFANFLFDPVCEGLVLLDFGSMVEVSATVAERYRRLVRAARVADRGRLRALALEFGWLAAGDPEPQQEGLVDLILLSTEPLRLPGVYNYGASDLAARTHDASMELAFERGLLRPPPPELLFIHRKLGGTYLLCASLKARVDSAALAASFVA